MGDLRVLGDTERPGEKAGVQGFRFRRSEHRHGVFRLLVQPLRVFGPRIVHRAAEQALLENRTADPAPLPLRTADALLIFVGEVHGHMR